MINVLKKINFLLTKRQKKGLILLTLLLFLGMILEVFGLGILVPALSILLDPENSNNLVLISKAKEFLPKTSNFDFSIYFLLFIVLEETGLSRRPILYNLIHESHVGSADRHC